MTKTTWLVYTNANLFFGKNRNWKLKMGKFTAKVIILWCDNFGENCTPLQRNGITAIPKKTASVLQYEMGINTIGKIEVQPKI